ncbi:CrcB family protein [Microbacterium sp.]|uniref:CrcB family protein n=1 Tax=Microbacterium sp. TaxID=51671 RepID=UPI0039E44EB2
MNDTPARRAAPVHLRASSLAVVFAGGTAGAAAREALTLAFATGDGIPWTILAINLSGAFLLGVLVDSLVRRGPESGGRRTLRLLLGTGLLGGYTTYSALAMDTAALLGTGAVGAGIGYGVGTVLVGAVATWAGILTAALLHRRHEERS